MKIVVFGPAKRTGVLHRRQRRRSVLCRREISAREDRARRMRCEMAEGIAPSNLARLIEGGQRALERRRRRSIISSARRRTSSAPMASASCAGLRIRREAARAAPRQRPHRLRRRQFRRSRRGDGREDARQALRGRSRRRKSAKAVSGAFGSSDREIVGPDGELVYPERCNRLDYEGEIAIVLGKRGVDLKPSQLKDYVWGVTMLADWSVRAPREPPAARSISPSRRISTRRCSLGPVHRGGRDRSDRHRHRDPGQWRAPPAFQHARWRSASANISNICRAISRSIPGDIISGGTAAGTAADSSALLPDKTSAPERFLKPGDTVEMKSPAIGSLVTNVVAKKK